MAAAVLALAAAWPMEASAQERARVRVVRAAGAESCPDEPTFNARLRKPSKAEGPPRESITVEFTLVKRGQETRFEATVRRGNTPLRDAPLEPFWSCEDLLVQVLAQVEMLLASQQEPGRVGGNPAPPRDTRGAARPPAASAAAPERRWWLGAGGGLVHGALPHTQPFVQAGAGRRLGSRFGVTALVFWMSSEQVTFRQGSAGLSLWGARLPLCGWLGSERLRVVACAEAWAGAMQGRGSGFSQNRTDTASWLVLGLALGLEGQPVGPVVVGLRGATLVAPAATRMVVERLGVVYTSARFVAAVDASLGATF